MILATDLDRTLLPNGDAEYDGSLPELYQIVERNQLTLVYVSGRNISMLTDAVSVYGIKLPDYFIGEVGTMVYVKENGALTPHPRWIGYVTKHSPLWNRGVMEEALSHNTDFRLQEDKKQNQFKLSYYVSATVSEEDCISYVEKTLPNIFDIEIVFSVDPNDGNIGLLDILPTCATKLTALEFLRKDLSAEQDEVIYCGDSGNDILPLTNGYRGILVRNAHPDTVAQVTSHHEKQNTLLKIYHAKGNGRLNGNYSSGIIEGLAHFKII